MTGNTESIYRSSMQTLREFINFCRKDVWSIRSEQLPRFRQFWLNQLRIFLLASKGFAEDNCQLRASALTFYSLLSIVPVVAMAFGVSKGFGLEERLKEELRTSFVGQEEVIQRIITFADSMLANVQGGFIAGIGVTVLLWSVLKVFSNIENSFNHIWGIQKSRTLLRKFSDYFSAMLICPLLFIVSSSATAIVSTKLEDLSLQYFQNETIHAAILTSLNYLAYTVIWILFCFLYLFLPNTKVSLRAGIFAGIIAGTLFKLTQALWIEFQLGVTGYGAIYGSFAALPLFLAWVQISWLIVLFGAEISYAEQNVDTYEYEPESRNASTHFQHELCLLLTTKCVELFDSKSPAPHAQALSSEFGIPSSLTERLLQRLVDADILSRIQSQDDEPACYQPAFSTDELRVCDVLNALDEQGDKEIPVDGKLFARIQKQNSSIQEAAISSPGNVLLRELVRS